MAMSKYPRKKMKIKGFILLCALSLVSLPGITSSQIEEGIPLKIVLQNIEKEHNVKFNYDESLIEDKHVSHWRALEGNLRTQLELVLAPLKLGYKQITRRNYVIIENESSNVQQSKKVIIQNQAPQKNTDQIRVKGVITSKTDNSTIPGVNITVKGTILGTVTDLHGNYEIDVDENGVLVFSFVGYKNVTVNVGGRSIIDIVLEEDIQALDEIVVIGYGVVRKSDLTGSLSSVSGEEISKVPVTSFDQALQGRAAGVQVRQVTGKPGGETSVRIRGTSSITAGNEPLYVIDGMMITSNSSATTAGGNRGPALNPLASINPSDIESIEILKDASATAIYGSRGSNGVVLVTTKMGKAGQSNISLDMYYGMQEVSKNLDVLNAEDFVYFVNKVDSDKGFPLDPDYLIPEKFGEGTDWQNALFRQAPIQSYQLNFNGGETKTKYMVSAGYFKQDGILVGSDFERLNFRINLEREVSEKINLGANIGISRIKSNGVLTNAGTLLPGVSMTALLFPPTLPVLDPNQTGGYTYDDYTGRDDRHRNLVNPYADAVEVQDNATNMRVIGTVFGTYEIMESLVYKLNFGFDSFSSKENRFVPNFLKRTEANNGEAVVATLNGASWLLENTVSYNKIFGTDHKLDAVVGFTTQAFSSEGLWAATLDFADNKTGYYAIQNGMKPQPSITYSSEWGMISFLGRVNYILKDKYLFTATGRVDGSSKFGENNRYGYFPSGSFAWRISNEEFFPKNETFSNLKARVSYGVIGNSDIGNYGSLSTVAVVGEGTFTNDQSYNGTAPLRYANPSLRWERANQFDGGLDFDMFGGRIIGTLDYYYRLTSDLLLDDQITATSGFTSTIRNIGSVINDGFEFGLNTVNIDKEVNWSSGIVFSVNNNKVGNLTEGKDVLISGALWLPTGWSILREGQPIGTFYGYQSDGVFQSEAEIQEGPLLISQAASGSAKPGDRRYKDIGSRDVSGNLTDQPDGIIDEADRTVLGQASPKFIWGFNNTVTYKNFDLSVFIHGISGNQVANVNLFEIGFLNGETNVLQDHYDNSWSEENAGGIYPRINPDRNDQGFFSDAYLEDGSFIRLQTLSLGYSFASGVLEKMRMSKFRAYVSGTNLFTYTDYSGYDPEVNAFGQNTLFQGADYGGYPTAKSVVVGIQITF